MSLRKTKISLWFVVKTVNKAIFLIWQLLFPSPYRISYSVMVALKLDNARNQKPSAGFTWFCFVLFLRLYSY